MAENKVLQNGLKVDVVWTIDKFEGNLTGEQRKAYLTGKLQPYKRTVFKGNVGLNEGINELLKLITGVGSPTAYNAANARIGVGDSDVAADPTQTGLQGASKAWKGMMADYPKVENQTATWRSEFLNNEAVFAWKEFTIVNAADDTGKNLDRKVSDQGTKPNTETWIATGQITIS